MFMAFPHGFVVATRRSERTTFNRFLKKVGHLGRFTSCQENNGIREEFNLLGKMSPGANQAIPLIDVTNFVRDRTMPAFSKPNMPELSVNIASQRLKYGIQKRRYIPMKLVSS